ncbi:hypothetical protein SAICODRAFT_16210 [Saitoella complicata NRRL Y-17804]|nr:uncharacterized protein SAICODRAFT_16210 [Saitoella complicata NRRL Y-17804]ODQ56181.1 hypothetical protein SAICODRAFT_16210 [Saitoella complicata NRRL Y-17804]
MANSEGAFQVSQELKDLERYIDEHAADPQADATIDRCCAYITALPASVHLFCERRLRKVMTNCLYVFSSPKRLGAAGDNAFLTRVADSVRNCHNCVPEYVETKEAFRKSLVLAGFEQDGIEATMESVINWDKNRLRNHLYNEARRLPPLTSAEQRGDQGPWQCAIYECLCVPQYLISQELYEPFVECFIAVKPFLRFKDGLLGGMVELLYERHPHLRRWAIKSLTYLADSIQTGKDTPIKPDTFNKIAKGSFFRALQRFMDGPPDPGLDGNLVFWNGTAVLINLFDKSTVIDSILGERWDIINFTCSRLPQDGPHLVAVIRCFTALVKNLGTDFWLRVHPPQQGTCIELILNSSALLDWLMNIDGPQDLDWIYHQKQKEKEQRDKELLGWTDPLAWIPYLITNAKASNKRLFCDRIMPVVLGSLPKTPNLPVNARAKCLEEGLSVMRTVMAEASEMYHIESEVHSIMQQEIRQIGDANAAVIIEEAFSKLYLTNERWVTIHGDACKIIELCAEMDCKRLKHEYKGVTEGNSAPSVLYGFERGMESFWEPLLSVISADSPEMCAIVLKATASIAFMEDLAKPAGGAGKASEKEDMFRRIRNSFQEIMQQILEKLSGLESHRLKEVLAHPEAVHALLQLTVSVNQSFQQEAIDIVKQANDAASRAEAIQGMFTTFFEGTCEGFTNAFEQFCHYKPFQAATRAVSTLATIVEVLTSPGSGVLTTDKDSVVRSQGNLRALYHLWQAMWKALDVLFLNCVAWAEKIDRDVMVDLMRDMLDLTTNLLDGYTAIDEVLCHLADMPTTEASRGKTCVTLPEDMAVPLKAIANWLRLNDEYLLRNAVSVLCRILGKMAQYSIIMDQGVHKLIDKVIRSAAKKGKNNNLSEEQVQDLRIALSEHYPEPEVPVAAPPKSNVPGSTTSSKIDFSKWQANAGSSSAAPISITDDDVRVRPVAGRPVDPRKALGVKPTAKPQASDAITRLRQEMAASAKRPIPHPQIRKPVVKKNETPGNSDDESDEEGVKDNGLFALAQESKPAPVVRKPIERRPIQMINMPMANRPNVDDMRRQRLNAERNLRARLSPDLSPLHRAMLKWDPQHAGDMPPDADRQNYQKVASTFATADRYSATFLPLFLLEAWQQIVRCKEEKLDQPFKFLIHNRASVDDFIDIFVTVSHDAFKDTHLSDTDVMAISQMPQPFKKDKENLACLAKVQSTTRKKDVVEVCLRCIPPPDMLSYIRPKMELYATKLWNLTPLHREYAALSGLQYYDLVDDIIKARIRQSPRPTPEQITRAMKTYNLNQPQAAAVLGAIRSQGFSLIQGPPGTGKTKTILGIVAAFMAEGRAKGQRIALPGQVQGAPPPPPKIMICAPSNAAVDEIVLRLKAGIYDGQGKLYKPNIVRLGMSDAINAAVRDVTLEALVDDQLEAYIAAEINKSGGPVKDATKLRDEMNRVVKERDEIRVQIEQAREHGQLTSDLESRLKALTTRKNNLGQALDESRDKQRANNRAKDIARRKIESDILAHADVICGTLSGSGHEMVGQLSITFETVIIDEAAQSVEVNALIPLKYGCKRCILVGDPNQLPPTVLSQKASSYGYDQSLFVRMYQRAPESVHLLSIQYRMHSEISRFPSKTFYDSQLIDGPSVDKQTARPWHASTLYTPYRFLNVKGREQFGRAHSVMNKMEVQAAMDLYEKIGNEFSEIDFDGKIGIVTPYRGQMLALKDEFKKKYGQTITTIVDFNTIDGFQGQEKEIIILSCVRAGSGEKSIGFLADVRRMNVALTRAKASIFILGNSDHLGSSNSKHWRMLIQDVKERGLLTDFTPEMLRQPTRTGAKPVVETSVVKAEPVVKMEGHAYPILPMENVGRDSAKDLTTGTEKHKVEDGEEGPAAKRRKMGTDQLPAPVAKAPAPALATAVGDVLDMSMSEAPAPDTKTANVVAEGAAAPQAPPAVVRPPPRTVMPPRKKEEYSLGISSRPTNKPINRPLRATDGKDQATGPQPVNRDRQA